MKALFLLISVILYQSNCLFAQHFASKNFRQEHGLPSNEVFDIEQDSLGYMWFATDRGLCKYDGYQFTTYTTKDGLPDNTVIKIIKDHRNRIWVFCSSNQLAYVKNDSIKVFEYNDRISEIILSSMKISDLAIDTLDNFYLSINGVGMFVIDNEGNVEQQRPKIDEYKFNPHYIIYQITNDKLIFLRGHVINVEEKQDPYNGLLAVNGRLIKLKRDVNYIPVKCSYDKDDSNRFQITLDNELIFFKEDTFQKYVTTGFISDVMIEGNKSWLSTNDGLILLDNEKLEVISTRLKGKAVSAAYRDHEFGLWVSTLYDGIYYFMNDDISVYNRDNTPNMSFNNVVKLGQDNRGNLFLGSNEASINILNFPDSIVQIAIPRGQRIYDFLYVPDNMLFITDHGLFYIRPDRSVNTFKSDFKAEFVDFYGKLFEISIVPAPKTMDKWADRVVIGSISGLLELDPESHKIQLISLTQEDMIRCLAVHAMDDSTVYVGGPYGLFKYTPGKRLTFIGDNEPFLQRKINDIHHIGQNNLLLAVEGYGLIIKTSDSLYQLSTAEGMVSNDLTTIAAIEKEIWVGSNVGISRISMEGFDPFRYSIQNFDYRDGMSSNAVNHILVNDSQVLVATNNGLTIMDRNNTTTGIIHPYVHISEISINNQPVQIRNHFNLHPDQQKITFSFIGVSFRSFGDINYKYRLSGVDNDWNYTRVRQVQYTELSHGTYEFEVMAQNKDGIWSKVPAKVNFTISAPFWWKWWFILAELLAGLGVMYFLINLRFKYLKTEAIKEERIEKEKARLELKALRAQMNPHFTFNTLNAIQSFITSRNTEQAEIYLAEFSGLIRKILQNSKEPVVLLKEELAVLDAYLKLEKMRFDDRFKYKIEIDASLMLDEIYIPGMLIQPYVENAIVHGLLNKNDDGYLKITIVRSNDQLKCTITDNGIGRTASAKLKKKGNNVHKSVGMSIAKDRLDLFNKKAIDGMAVRITDLEDEEGNATGTEVELLIDYISHED